MPVYSEEIRVVFSVTNSVCYDQRVLKMAGTIKDMGCVVTIIGRLKHKNHGGNIIPFSNHRFRMLFTKGFLFYTFFNLRLFFYLLFIKCDILVANDLDTLLPSFIVSRIRKLPLIYDSHEYFTGVPELSGRKFVTKVWETIEKLIFPKLKNIITVSDSIADLYAEKYGVRPMVVRNLSESYSDFPAVSRDFTGINKDDFLVILQGTGINIDKGAEELTDAIALTEGTSLIIVGSGDVITDIERKVMDQHLEDRIKFFGPVDSKTLAGYTRMADAGMCLEKDTNINYRYSLPNKLFDYLSAGIPVICSKLPETAGIISNHKCGLLLEAVTPFEIAKAITLLKDDDSLYRGLRNNAEKAGAILTWEEESIVVKELYGNIISKIKDGKN